ncbi:MAG: hypothetical protein AAGC92_14280 [Pseudomonadota bacterium]
MTELAKIYADDDGEDVTPIKAIMNSLQIEAKKRVGRRTNVEERWIQDLRQYHGRYDELTETDLRTTRRSTVYINRTRRFCLHLSARLNDMLFPTDDRNWAIEPSPVPQLAEVAQNAMREAKRLREEAEAAAQAEAEQAQMGQQMPPEAASMDEPAAQPQDLAMLDPAAPGAPAEMMPMPEAELEEQPATADQMAAQAEEAQETALRAHEIMEEARQRAVRMQKAIEDVLVQTQYPKHAQDAIKDAVKLGMGILKGPVKGDMTRRGWKKGKDGVYELIMQADEAPAIRHVDPWSFFPDPEARTLEECEGIFERHLMNRKQLRRLARMPGFNKTAIQRLLSTDGGKEQVPSYLTRLRNITSPDSHMSEPRWPVWEYSGPISAEHLGEMYSHLGDEEAMEDLQEGDGDPLREENVVLWFCGDELLKVGPYPLDSGEPIYSIYTIETDESSVFGYGVPYLIRDEQRVTSASWRMMMDNAGMGVGPQVVVDTEQITPMDGEYELRGAKIWSRVKAGVRDSPPFEQHKIDVNVQEIAAIVEMASRQMEDVTALPEIARGEPGTGVQQTATGTALLMSSANVPFRDMIRCFDNTITLPTIRRLYDWLMQFSEDDEIKGDHEVKARGASVLLVREMQTQNLLMILQVIGQDPDLAPLLRKPVMLRRIVQSLMLSADDLVLTDDEIEEQQEAAAVEPDPTLELQERDIALRENELEAKVEIANMESNARLEVARINQETAMMQAAERSNQLIEQGRAKLDQAREALEVGERKLAAEIGMRERTGVSSGGAV